MATNGTVFLMYHELAIPGRSPCQPEPGYTRYMVPASSFQTHMRQLANEGWSGQNVSRAIESFGGKKVCITFDDGCETDLISAAPVLKELGFGATSYLTVEFLGKPGFLSHAQVRELHDLGFEIGCHSLSHPYLTDIDDVRLREETAGAKERLEQIVGARVDHYSCPGGRRDARVMAAVKQANFRTMATSLTGMNFLTTDRFALSRIAMLDNTDSEALLRTCRGEGLFRARLMEKTRAAAKAIFGNTAYDSLRNIMLSTKRRAGPKTK